MLTITDRLSKEDLARYQELDARFKAVEINPRAFTAEETVQAVLDWYRFCQEVSERYEVDEGEAWKISPTDATIYYGSED